MLERSATTDAGSGKKHSPFGGMRRHGRARGPAQSQINAGARRSMGTLPIGDCIQSVPGHRCQPAGDSVRRSGARRACVGRAVRQRWTAVKIQLLKQSAP